MDTRKRILSLPSGDWINAVAFSPKGKEFATAGEDGAVFIRRLPDGKELGRMDYLKAVNSVAFSPDGRYIATGDTNRTVKIWDLVTSRELVRRAAEEDSVIAVDFTPDQQYLVSVNKNGVRLRLWRPDDLIAEACGRLTRNLTKEEWRQYIGEEPYRKTCQNLSPSNDESATALTKAEGDRTDPAGGAASQPDNQPRLAAAADDIRWVWEKDISKTPSESGPGTVHSGSEAPADTDKGTADARPNTAKTGANGIEVLQGHTEGVWKAIFSPDGKRLITISSDMTARMWDATAAITLAVLPKHSGIVVGAAFSPDGKFLVTGEFDGAVRVWDASDGKAIAKLDHGSGVRDVAFSSDGRLLATTGEDVRIWDAASYQKVTNLKTDGFPVFSNAAFSPDGKWIITAGEGEHPVQLWDAQSGKTVGSLDGHTDSVLRAVFGPDGKLAATANGDGSASIWDVTNRTTLFELRGHTGEVSSVAFSPDGNFLVTASADQTARVWDVATGKTVAILRGHTDAVNSAMFSPDGTFVATASSDRTARIYSWKMFVQNSSPSTESKTH
jgi:WD40 repeat protein